MTEKYIVVQGAVCKCQFGQLVDKIKVLSHEKEYANDKDASKKLIVTTQEIGGATLEKNTFGNCLKMGNPPPPCRPMITEWKNFYDKVTLNNGGNIILEDSKAVCAIAGTPCIEIIDHGQRTQASKQNFKNANKDVHKQINPLVNPEEMYKQQPEHKGIEDSVNGEEETPEVIDVYFAKKITAKGITKFEKIEKGGLDSHIYVIVETKGLNEGHSIILNLFQYVENEKKVLLNQHQKTDLVIKVGNYKGDLFLFSRE